MRESPSGPRQSCRSLTGLGPGARLAGRVLLKALPPIRKEPPGAVIQKRVELRSGPRGAGRGYLAGSFATGAKCLRFAVASCDLCAAGRAARRERSSASQRAPADRPPRSRTIRLFCHIRPSVSAMRSDARGPTAGPHRARWGRVGLPRCCGSCSPNMLSEPAYISPPGTA